jgi:hypothetical protein
MATINQLVRQPRQRKAAKFQPCKRVLNVVAFAPAFTPQHLKSQTPPYVKYVVYV